MRLVAVLVGLLLSGPTAEAPVADAAERGDVESVRELLRSGADVNAAQGDGMSALHWAARTDSPELVDVLLYAGANTESTTRLGGYTPVHLAARAGSADALDRLLAGGAKADARTTTGVAAAHFAASSGVAASVETLVRHGADVDVRTVADEQTPLMWATALNRVETIRVLLDVGADPSLTTSVVDYAAIAAADRPERQLRSQLASVRRNAQRAAAGDDAPEQPGQARAGPPEDEAEEGEEPAEEAGSEAADSAASATPASEEVPAAEPTQPEPEVAPEIAESEEAAGQPAEVDEEEPSEPEEAEGESSEGDETATPAEEERPLGYNDLVGLEGGFAALHFAAREGHVEAADLLLAGGADVNQPTAGDGTGPLLMATINGNFDLAMRFLEDGGDPNLVAEDGAAPLFTVLNRRWGPKAAYPQPAAFQQQETDYLELLSALIDAGADVNHRTGRHIWYTSFNFDMLGVNFAGATAFWRAAYATDVEAMRLLVAAGADAAIPTRKVPTRRFRRGGDQEDKSGLPPLVTGDPAVYPIHAASGVGYGEGFAANSHSHAPDSWLSSVRYLVEEHGADVNARDLNGYSPVHHAAARGDNELIEYLVEQGADVMVVSRRGETTIDMANGPRQRVQPFPTTIALLESLGAVNNHNCQSCE
jgi:ankyrin repeat protein